MGVSPTLQDWVTDTDTSWLGPYVSSTALAPCITRVRPTIRSFFHSELNTNMCIHSGSELFPKSVCVCGCVCGWVGVSRYFFFLFFWKQGWQCGVQVHLPGRASLFVTCFLYSESLPPDTGRWQVSSKAGPSHLLSLLLCPSRIDSISLYSAQRETWRPYWVKQLKAECVIFFCWNKRPLIGFILGQDKSKWSVKVVRWFVWKDRWRNYHLKMYIIRKWCFGEGTVVMNTLGLFSSCF